MSKTILIISLGATAVSGMVVVGLLVNTFHTHRLFAPIMLLAVGSLLIGFGILVNKAGWKFTLRK